ncbi:hypothetical protein SAMN04488011_10136 [Palleronia pelagia]|uniref:Uncharacterized protein n=2 Tax=Palleronia pelagia TaxID=387096 RepID=A0A1H8A777_9RHOB|nr:hypothetical protein SAMN04488011_10136 [Palleronia pelagia]
MPRMNSLTDTLSPLLATIARREAVLFRDIGWILLAFSLFAFAQKLVVVPDRIERYTPLVTLHGAVMLGWLGLFTLQAELQAHGRMGWHKTLGIFSTLLVGVAVWTGFIVSREFSGEADMIEVFLANLVHLSGLAIFWAAGVVAAIRHRIDIHRRMMLLAALAILSPPISRVTQTLGLPNGMAAGLHLGLVLALPAIYDLATRGRLHRATLAAFTVIFVLSGLAAAAGVIPPLNAAVSAYLGLS